MRRYIRLRFRAFTLLEVMVALLVISGGIILFQLLSQNLTSQLKVQMESPETKWVLLASQLETELSKGDWVKVENNQIYYRDGKDIRRLAFYKKRGDLRKTDQWGQGYAPLVYGLEDFQVESAGKDVLLTFRFKGGLERRLLFHDETKV